MNLSKFLTALPDFKGKRRLIRILFGQLIKKKKDLIITGTHGIEYKLPNCVEIIGFEIFVNGIYEKATSSFIIKHLPKDGLYIDIGANIGGIALPIAKQRPDIKVVCVEASQNVFNYLYKNIELNNLANVILIHKAVSDTDGESLEFFTPNKHFGKGCLVNTDLLDTKESVITIQIDTLIKQYKLDNINLIKIDIEGYEYYAFKGAENLLTSAKAPDIVFEFENYAEVRAKDLHAGDAQKLLLNYGYKLFSIGESNIFKRITKPFVQGCCMIWATKR